MKPIFIKTEEQAKKYHVYMWRWLSKHPGAEKRDWPGWKIIEDRNYYCFACLVGKRRSNNNPEYRCQHCPIVAWKSDNVTCLCDRRGQLYYKWKMFCIKPECGMDEQMKQLSELALQVSELEWE